MKLSKKDIEEFQDAIYSDKGKMLSFEEAERQAYDLLELVQIICEPLPGERPEVR